MYIYIYIGVYIYIYIYIYSTDPLMRVSSIISSQRFSWGSERFCLDIQF